MIINDVDILDKYNATIIDRKLEPCDVINYDDWLTSAIEPTNIKDDGIEWSHIEMKLLVEGESEEDVLLNISGIIVDCRRGVLKYSDMPDIHYQIILSDSNNKIVYEKAYELSLSFTAGQKIMTEATVEANRVANKTVNVSGNTTAPCIITVTPSIGIADLIITGIARDPITGEDEPIKIKNLEPNIAVIIDGEACKITCAGANKFADSDFWQWPSLVPGENTITFSRVTCDVTITYKPRYL